MPLQRDFSFVALDEAQLGKDPERGHIFTDRMLRARGRDETMILGSGALSGMVRALLSEAEIISRPRFSTLSYAGAKKLSRLPKRSAIVAFSAEEVYTVAEMLRRLRCPSNLRSEAKATWATSRFSPIPIASVATR